MKQTLNHVSHFLYPIFRELISLPHCSHTFNVQVIEGRNQSASQKPRLTEEGRQSASAGVKQHLELAWQPQYHLRKGFRNTVLSTHSTDKIDHADSIFFHDVEFGGH